MGKLLQLAVFSPTPDQLVPLFVHAIVLNLSPSGCHLILAVRSLRHPFKIPGWCTYQVVYVHTRGIPTSARKDATGNRLYACLGRTPYYQKGVLQKHSTVINMIKFYYIPRFYGLRLIYELQKKVQNDGHLLINISPFSL